jgi:hypothetical protein
MPCENMGAMRLPMIQASKKLKLMKNTKLILLAALLCTPGIIHAVTVITSLPYSVTAPGSYELQKNLTANGTDGIDVNASNVTINLGGNTLSQSQAGTGNGILVSSGISNVSVQNGTITGFFYGVRFEPGSADTLTNVQVLSSSVGVLVTANDCLVESCNVIGTGNSFGIAIQQCSAVCVKDNQVSQQGYGIVESSVTTPNAVIKNCEANCTYGLILSSTSKYQNNITINCTTPISGGIAVGDDNG